MHGWCALSGMPVEYRALCVLCYYFEGVGQRGVPCLGYSFYDLVNAPCCVVGFCQDAVCIYGFYCVRIEIVSERYICICKSTELCRLNCVTTESVPYPGLADGVSKLFA